MNEYFINISKSLKIKPNLISSYETIHKIVTIFQYHHSIQRIKSLNFENCNVLNFSQVNEKDVRDEILNLSSKKATRKGDIPANILRDNIEIYVTELTRLINTCLLNGTFPYELKLADVSPIFKKKTF